MIYLFFIPILASFVSYLANDYLAVNALHGIFSADVFLLIAIWSLPRKTRFKIVLIVSALLVGVFYNPILGTLLFLTVLSSYVKKDSFWPSFPIFAAFFLISLISDCLNLFDKAFRMDFFSFWDAATYFWWGKVLFFLVPIVYLALVLFFVKKLFWRDKSIVITPKFFFLCAIVLFLLNPCLLQFQQRQIFVDFPIADNFWKWNTFSPLGDQSLATERPNEMLSEETQAVFNIWDKESKIDMSGKTVSVLVESFGVHKDTTIAKQMIKRSFANSKVSFQGIMERFSMYTQGAELEDFGSVSVKDSNSISLLRQLNNEGIESYYLHGYSGRFYKRDSTYKTFGFDQLLFIKDFNELNAPNCDYGFEGICDTSIIKVIDSLLNEPSPKFIYWTTLDSHPPYKSDIDLPTRSIFCKNLTIEPRMCTYLSLIENTLNRVAKLANKYPDYKFIIRGDHRPMATINPDDFYYGWVPLIILN